MIQHKIFRFSLLAETVLLILFSILQSFLPVYFPTLSAFPFSQLGLGLRMLSLSGKAGNIAAFLLYISVCLLPAVSLLLLKRKEALHGEDSILVLISLAMFPALYLMVNPGYLPLPGSEGVCCAVLWSLAACWLTLRLLRSLTTSDKAALTRRFSLLLRVAAFYFVYEIFGVLLPAMIAELSELCQPQTLWADTPYTDAEVAFSFLRYAVGAVPPAVSILVIFRSVSLVDLLHTESEETAAAANALSLLCARAMGISVSSVAALNLIQFVLFHQLRNIHITVVLPVLELAIVLMILLLARYIAENKQLKDDNDLFI